MSERVSGGLLHFARWIVPGKQFVILCPIERAGHRKATTDVKKITCPACKGILK